MLKKILIESFILFHCM